MKFSGYNRESGIGSIKSLKFYDKWLFPISVFLDKIGFKYLIGKNLILEAKKINEINIFHIKSSLINFIFLLK